MNNFTAMKREQREDLAAINRIVDDAVNKLEALDKGLRPEVRTERQAAIRDKAAQDIGPIRQRMAKRAADAKEAAPGLAPDVIRRAARFHTDDATDAAMRLAAADRLGRAANPELLNYLDDAVRDKNLAMAEAVRAEFSARNTTPPELKLEFEHRMRAATTPEAQEGLQIIDQVVGNDLLGAERLSALYGRPDPVARITAARLAA